MTDKPSPKSSPHKPWWAKGIRWECQGSGKCCMSRGGYGFVYLTLTDRRRMAKHLKLTVAAFTRKYCDKTDGWYHLKEEAARPECLFLDNKRCTVYEARPTQCRTWPFWPDHMGAKTWTREVAAFCPGVGKGRVHSEDEVRKQLELQRQSERNPYA